MEKWHIGLGHGKPFLAVIRIALRYVRYRGCSLRLDGVTHRRTLYMGGYNIGVCLVITVQRALEEVCVLLCTILVLTFVLGRLSRSVDGCSSFRSHAEVVTDTCSQRLVNTFGDDRRRASL